MIVIPLHSSEASGPQPQNPKTLGTIDLCILSHVIGDHLFALHRYAGSLPALHRYDNCKNMQATCYSYTSLYKTAFRPSFK